MSLVQKPVNTLVSFHYYRKSDIAELAGLGLRMVGDSGAYSAWSQGTPMDRDEFFEWAVKWRDHFYWTASLDVAFDAEASWDNWQARPDTLPGLVPTIHYGDEPRVMDRYVEAGASLLGMGGMVPFKSEPKRLLRWCLRMMRHARDHHPHVRFHGWGVTHPTLMMNLPWWSVDSSGFGAAYRYGRTQLFDPDLKRSVAVLLNGRDTAKHARLLRESYGVHWRDVAVSVPANRRELIHLGTRSMQLMEKMLQDRHQVTPPPCLAGPPTGPLLHYAEGWDGHLRDIVRPTRPPTTGPLIHYADGHPRNMRDIVNPPKEPTTGPLIHYADGYEGNMRDIPAPPREPQTGPLIHYADTADNNLRDIVNPPTGPLIHTAGFTSRADALDVAG